MLTNGSFQGSFEIYSGDFSICNKSSLHSESSSSLALTVSGLADETHSVLILGKWWSEFASELLWGVCFSSSKFLISFGVSSYGISISFWIYWTSISLIFDHLNSTEWLYSTSDSSLYILLSDLTRLVSQWTIF